MFATSLFRPPWLPCLAFASYYLCGLAGWCSPVLAHWPITSFLWASLAHLLFLYLLLLPWVYCFIPWAFSAHLLHFYLLSLLWACWPSFLPCQPIELTILFLGLPLPIYFFFISHCPHGLTTSLLGLPQPTYLFFTYCYFHGFAGHHSCHVSPLGLLPHFFFYHFTLHLPLISLIVGLLLLLGLLSKIGINSLQYDVVNDAWCKIFGAHICSKNSFS